MKDYKDKLINKPEAFLRKTFETRMKEFGFKNMERMENFLMGFGIVSILKLGKLPCLCGR